MGSVALELHHVHKPAAPHPKPPWSSRCRAGRVWQSGRLRPARRMIGPSSDQGRRPGLFPEHGQSAAVRASRWAGICHAHRRSSMEAFRLGLAPFTCRRFNRLAPPEILSNTVGVTSGALPAPGPSTVALLATIATRQDLPQRRRENLPSAIRVLDRIAKAPWTSICRGGQISHWARPAPGTGA